jgi:NADPH:quinone reductase-like Zn-dependent oxidoreductase
MKAVILRQLGGPDQVQIEERAIPEPGPGQVRVRLQASALNRRDVWITLGQYPGLRLPCTTGSDGAGVVDKIGPVAPDDLLGQDWLGQEVVIYPAYDWGANPIFPSATFRVLGMPDPGTFAEYLCVPAGHLFPKPAHLNWEQAAAIPLAGLTSWRALMTQGAAQPGETVLVTGIGGGVATFALKWAVALGAHVFVTSGDDHKLEQARQLGAAGGVNYRADDWDKQLAKLTGGVDVVVDGTGGFLGFVHIKDTLDIVDEPGAVVSAAAVRYLPRLPATVPLPDALSRMRQSNSHLALMLGADGTVCGMVTLEDLVEDLVGTVRDGMHRD